MDSNNFKIINVSSTSISIEIVDPSLFDDQFNLGSYIKIPYKNNDTKFVIGIIENYRIKDEDNGDEETESINVLFGDGQAIFARPKNGIINEKKNFIGAGDEPLARIG